MREFGRPCYPRGLAFAADDYLAAETTIENLFYIAKTDLVRSECPGDFVKLIVFSFTTGSRISKLVNVVSYYYQTTSR